MAAPVVPTHDAMIVPRGQNPRIYGRFAGQCAFDHDPAGGSKQTPQQDDERDVIQEVDMKDFVGRLTPVCQEGGEGEDQRPHHGDLGIVVMPESGSRQG